MFGNARFEEPDLLLGASRVPVAWSRASSPSVLVPTDRLKDPRELAAVLYGATVEGRTAQERWGEKQDNAEKMSRRGGVELRDELGAQPAQDVFDDAAQIARGPQPSSRAERERATAQELGRQLGVFGRERRLHQTKDRC